MFSGEQYVLLVP